MRLLNFYLQKGHFFGKKDFENLGFEKDIETFQISITLRFWIE
jgi:hypothetical protein